MDNKPNFSREVKLLWAGCRETISLSGQGGAFLDIPDRHPPKTEEGTRYEPSTSLEQISDWLTKIIVGVGLTKLSEIPVQLWKVASYVAPGLGGGEAAKVFALGIIIYFSGSGFLFGYLWSRLYMMEAFRAADVLRRVEELSNEMVDLRAKALVESHLDPSKPEVASDVLAEAIDEVSDDAKEQVFQLAKEARSGDNANDRTRKRAIPVLRALIDADPENADQEYHAELCYVLLRSGELKEAVDQPERPRSSRIFIAFVNLPFSSWLRYPSVTCELDTGTNA